MSGNECKGPNEQELRETRALMGDFNECIVRRLEAGVTHEDVISACLNLAAHHANKLGMRPADYISYAYEALREHDRAKEGR